jgi:hypothetical protein
MSWFSNLFKKKQIAGGIYEAGGMYEQTVLADLAALQGLPPLAQHAIAVDVSKFINLATISEALLDQFLIGAMQERHQSINDGASSNQDPRWAAASLTEAWCTAS